MIDVKDLKNCPDPVARYLRKAGVLSIERKAFAHILHGGEFRLKPKQRWFPIKGEYHFRPEARTFDWQARITFFPLVFVTVRDEYEAGIGRSLVKLEGILPIGDQTGAAVNESSLCRLLVELIMMPTALVPGTNLYWEAIDAQHARVVLSDSGFKVAAVVEFNDQDLPVKTSIDRLGEFDGEMKKVSFVCELSNYNRFDGLLIPCTVNGYWDLPEEKFYWLCFQVTKAEFAA